MKIEKILVDGKLTVPSTSEEQTALEFILKALEETYVKVVITEHEPTSQSLIEVPARNTVETM